MRTSKTLATIGMCVSTALTLAVGSVQADTQSNKNAWRNITAGAGAVAAFGLLHANPAALIIGGAGAAYSAHRYDQERRSQDQHNGYNPPKYHHRRHLFE